MSETQVSKWRCFLGLLLEIWRVVWYVKTLNASALEIIIKVFLQAIIKKIKTWKCKLFTKQIYVQDYIAQFFQ